MPQVDSANVMLMGHFNPYLISPEWLKQEDIWGEEEVQLMLGAINDGVEFRAKGVAWKVSSRHLQIASTPKGESLEDCGELASKVLSKLPHTPMRAVGSNFVFQLPEDTRISVFDEIDRACTNRVLPELVRWGMLLDEGEDKDKVRREVSFSKGTQGITVSFNHHRTTLTTSVAQEAAGKFFDDFRKSKELIEKFTRENQEN